MIKINSTTQKDCFRGFFFRVEIELKYILFYLFSDSATMVDVNIFVRSFSSIDDVKMVRT